MTDRETLLRLADRCEEATGADRELDAEIAVAAGEGETGYCDSDWSASRFTASLDAAESLVPSGWSWHAVKQGRRGTGWASVTDPGQEGLPACKAATPALALCAAALRARAEGVE